MAELDIVFSKTNLELRAAPINPAWILDGQPVARNTTLSRSADGVASTLVWDCTAGTFNWFYDIDETIYVVEGSVVVETPDGETHQLGPGDTLFFPKGSQARWHVDSYVRKVAFCRRVQPKLLTFVARALSRIKRSVMPGRPAAAFSLLGAE